MERIKSVRGVKSITISTYVVCVILVLFLMGCGDGGQLNMSFRSSDPESTDAGSASFSIRWHNASALSGSEGPVAVNAIGNCESEGIVTVSCDVYDDAGVFLVSGGPWSCAYHKGGIDGIPAGRNRQFVIFGTDDAGNIIYQGLSCNDITIVSGETTPVGTIDAHFFVPSLSAPVDGAIVTPGTLSFDWGPVENAHEYHIQVSETDGFESPIVDEIISGTSHTPPTLSTSTTYYWRIYALDVYNNQSAGSEVRRFTTNSVPVAMDDTFTGIQVFSADNELNVLENDSDPDANEALTITHVDSPSTAGGMVAVNANGDRLIYTPPMGYYGEDAFSYTIEDGQGHTATAQVAVTVVAGNARVSVDSQGQQIFESFFNASISGNGRYVAFILMLESDGGGGDVYIYDRRTGILELVSVSSTGAEANGYSYDPVVSNDGRFVAFQSAATNLVPNDNNQVFDVFIRDRQGAGDTERVSVSSAGVEANGDSSHPTISADGRFVAFVSYATNLVDNDNNDTADIFIRDRQGTGATERISIASEQVEANGASFEPAVSSDGRFIVFYSFASNLVQNDYNRTADIFIRDRQGTGFTERVSVSSTGAEANGYSGYPSVSADGRFVVFTSEATNLVQYDNNQMFDVFIRDRQSPGDTERVSVSSTGVEANDYSYYSSMSTDGRFVAFQSSATNLVQNDNNGMHDIFIRDRRGTGFTERVSISSTGAEANGYSFRPTMSADGRFVAFDSGADNLVPDDTNGFWDVFTTQNPLFPWTGSN